MLHPSLKGPPLIPLYFFPKLIHMYSTTHINKHFPFLEKKVMTLLTQTIFGSFMSEVRIFLLKFYLKGDWVFDMWVNCSLGGVQIYSYFIQQILFQAFWFARHCAKCWHQKNFHKCVDSFYLRALLPMGSRMLQNWWLCDDEFQFRPPKSSYVHVIKCIFMCIFLFQDLLKIFWITFGISKRFHRRTNPLQANTGTGSLALPWW